jgi:hypothetical protein
VVCAALIALRRDVQRGGAPAGPRVEREARLPAAARGPGSAIGGRVLAPSGEPQPGAGVLVLRLDDRQPNVVDMVVAQATTDNGGAFLFEALPEGRYRVSATAASFVPALSELFTLTDASPQTGLELRLRAGGIRAHGLISDIGGGPIAGARITAVTGPYRAPEVYAAASGPDGRFELRLPEAPYRMVASAEGYSPGEQNLRLYADRYLTFSLVPAAVIHGRVVERATGKAVAGARVDLAGDGAAVRTKQSTENGVFEFRDVSPGRYELEASAGPLVGRTPQPITITLAAYNGEVTLSLDAGRAIAGRVSTDGGQAVPDADLFLNPTSAGTQTRRQARTDGQGRYRFEGVVTGRYAITVSTPATAPSTRGSIVVAREDLKDVDFVLSPGTEVVGRVVGPGGRAVAGANVRAFVSGLRGARSWKNGKSDGGGRFILRPLGAGSLTVEVDHPELGAKRYGPVAVEAGEKREVVVELGEPLSIAGTVMWSDGSPAPSVAVAASSAAGEARATTDGEGRFTLSPVAAGEVTVEAHRREAGPRATGAGQARLVLGQGERRTGLVLTLAKGDFGLSGAVVDRGGGPVPDCLVAVAAGQGWDARHRETTYADPEGRFRFDDLEPGKYELTARCTGHTRAVHAGAVAGGPPVSIVVQRGASISGLVVEGGGAPVTDYQLSAVATGPREASREAPKEAPRKASVATVNVHNPEGRFKIEELPAGAYELVVANMTGDTAVARVAVAAGEARRDLRIVTDGGIEVRGQVVGWEDDAPLPDSWVRFSYHGVELHTLTDRRGAFVFRGAPRGSPAQIRLGKDFYLSDWMTFRVESSDRNVDLGRIALVRDAGGGPASGTASAGVAWVRAEDQLLVSSVDKDSAAARTGIRVGDRLLKIDGRDAGALASAGVTEVLRRTTGASVRLSLAGREVSLVRAGPGPTSAAR